MESPTSITEETRYMDTATVATELRLKKERELQLNIYYGVYPINWSTQKQATVALSSCESEFIAATTEATQALWLKRLLSKLTHSQEEKVTIQVDNKSDIALMKNPVFHGRSKHIDTKYHFIRECVEREDIQVEFVIHDSVGVRRMEEIDVEVLFDAWKKIYMRSKEQKAIFTCYFVPFLSLVVKHSFKGMQDLRNGCGKWVKNARSKRL
ncbi:hypothetical protein Tco_1400356 [Tanacetum coccineum]